MLLNVEWGDWWYWQVGIAKVVGNLLVLLYDDISKSLLQDYIAASRYFVAQHNLPGGPEVHPHRPHLPPPVATAQITLR